jgi:hypothetical protein
MRGEHAGQRPPLLDLTALLDVLDETFRVATPLTQRSP